MSWEELQNHNAIANPYRLPPGQVLRFPIAWLRVEPAPARVVAVRGQVDVSAGGEPAAAVREGMRLPIGSHIQSLYRQAIDKGYGRQDLLGWYELIEKGIFDG